MSDMYPYLIRSLFWVYSLVLGMAFGIRRALRRGPLRGDERQDFVILATGTFFSSNWLRSHLLPLLSSPACGRLILVCDAPLIEHPKLENRCAPAWLKQLVGRVPARAALVFLEAVRCRPDFVMGYHLLPNALIALLAARVVGARSIYQCCGGEAELDGGGPAMFENGLLKRVRSADDHIAARLRSFVPEFDVIVTRGRRASAFFKETARGEVTVIPAGIDAHAYAQNGTSHDFDLISVSRLVEMKRLDVFVEVVAGLVHQGLRVRAAIVGEGPERSTIAAQIRRLGLEAHITLAGQQHDVASWLRRAKVFVLTSDSEGLSIALAEAMMTGLPAVVSRVGDLPMLVADAANGFLVPRRDVALFVDRVERLLCDEALRRSFSVRARERAVTLCGQSEVSRRWTETLRAAWVTDVPRRDALARTHQMSLQDRGPNAEKAIPRGLSSSEPPLADLEGSRRIAG